MEDPEQLHRLPDAYRHALRLHRQGADLPDIATQLGIEPAAAGPLLKIAQAKLRALAVTPPPDPPRTQEDQ